MSSPNGKYLMLYSTTDGHTKTIMDTMAKHIMEEAKVQCDVVDMRDGDKYELAAYEKVMLGASIRYGFFSRTLHTYTTHHVDELNSMPSAFFGVNLTARKTSKNTAMTNAYTRKFLDQSMWVPQLSGVFAGALWYPRYNFFDRVMIQFIMKVTGGETNTTKEIVYTDWDAVHKFATDFVQLPATAIPRSKPATSVPPASVANYDNGARVALVVVGISAAIIFGRRLILAKRF
ncbi:protoporphyrinogen oxidase-like protein [Leptomonas pyrrhocoris]|uniref:Protoporphyrinogen oxidase-like protein n=1 Tax=Leptomonas pyrrhocoris TaxID=157538 RepID=A0A0M9G4G3_LEPPY|nr:protoporphyrinogen oxidase-like protein [Leptomonas pyrrhocoris]XP_015660368.1 protoporphyrinogen oxidase-like protein [Leptomonas pyrrhocoris]KPA81928.1 protoporphyrinogen oxidase-like protein [Leptomonas pyrrhocoris]KPA81929.1 protoporphyrinogen oxidase-like protein [Leptomonas pyrrhocoris]|eukprot:XP_015660367.1 protoporphyrinogen oxidase-like protein [Leptomonas pyrrhocoris]